jgi:hypothetical protein
MGIGMAMQSKKEQLKRFLLLTELLTRKSQQSFVPPAGAQCALDTYCTR